MKEGCRSENRLSKQMLYITEGMSLSLKRIELKQICKTFGTAAVLTDVSLDVNEGEFFTIVGSSGSGKSTLLRIVAGLEVPDSGSVAMDGKLVDHVAPANRDMAMVFQSHALYPHLTVEENMSVPLRMQRLSTKQRLPLLGNLFPGTRALKRKIADDVRSSAALLGLESYLDRKPAQLSGGQRQRVAIGRAIVRHPKAFLMDEPLSSLDPTLRLQLRSEVLHLKRRLNATILYITHDRSEALTMSDRIAVMHGGRVLQVGTPTELLRTPLHQKVAEFVTETIPHYFAGTVRSDGAIESEIGTIPISVKLPAGTKLVVFIDPKAWRIREVRSNSDCIATVRFIDRTGIMPVAHLELPGQTSLVTIQNSHCDGLVEGNAVRIEPLWSHIHLFDHAGDRIVSGNAAFAR